MATTFNKEQIRDIQLLLESKRGHIKASADALGISRTMLNSWIRQSPELTETLEDIHQAIVDTLLLKLELIATEGKGSLPAIKMYLNGPAGRRRGWGDGPEVAPDGTVVEDSKRDETFKLLVPTLSKAQLRVLAEQESSMMGSSPN